MQDSNSVLFVGDRKKELLGLSIKFVKDLEEKKCFFLMFVAILEREGRGYIRH